MTKPLEHNLQLSPDSTVDDFCKACSEGYLDLAKCLVLKFGLTSDDVRKNANRAFRYACSNGHLDVAKWMTDQFKLTITDSQSVGNYAFRFACSNGHLDVVKWMADEFKLNSVDAKNVNYAFHFACYEGHLELVKWLIDTFEIDNSFVTVDMFTNICKHMDILQFIIQRYQLSAETYSKVHMWCWCGLITSACERENVFIVSWLITNFPDRDIPEYCKEFVQKVRKDNEIDIMIKPATKQVLSSYVSQ